MSISGGPKFDVSTPHMFWPIAGFSRIIPGFRPAGLRGSYASRSFGCAIGAEADAKFHGVAKLPKLRRAQCP